MKRSIIFIAAALLVGTSARAEIKFDLNMANKTFTEGNIVAYANFGLNSHYFGGFHFTSLSMPVSLGAEYCIKDKLIGGKNGSIGIGAHLYGETCTYKYQEAYNSINFLALIARGSFHYQFIPKLDTYAALDLGIGWSNLNGENTEGKYAYNELATPCCLYLGGRYWFSDSLAGCAELGIGREIFRLGVAKRF